MGTVLNIFMPLITASYLILFKNIWNFKRYLKSRENPNKILLRAYEYYFHRYGAWIGYKCEIAENTVFPHGFYGIFISNDAIIHDGCTIFQQVTIGSNTVDLHLKNNQRYSPIVQKNCYIGAGAKIIGGITIGANCRIGANAVAYCDIPTNSVVVASKTRIIQKNETIDNRFYSFHNNDLLVLTNGKYEKVHTK